MVEIEGNHAQAARRAETMIAAMVRTTRVPTYAEGHIGHILDDAPLSEEQELSDLQIVRVHGNRYSEVMLKYPHPGEAPYKIVRALDEIGKRIAGRYKSSYGFQVSSIRGETIRLLFGKFKNAPGLFDNK